jgi:hypothetical protein
LQAALDQFALIAADLAKGTSGVPTIAVPGESDSAVKRLG